MFENRVLREIFGAKRDEVTGEWRKLHNEELYDLYCQLNIIRVIKSNSMRWAGHAARMGVTQHISYFAAKCDGKRPFGRRRCRREDI